MGDLHAALMLVHVSINLGIISFHIVAPEILKKKKKVVGKMLVLFGRKKLQIQFFSDAFIHVNSIVSSCSAIRFIFSSVFSMLVSQEIEDLIFSVQ